MLTTAYAIAAAAILGLAAVLENTPPRQIARHLRRNPGAVFVGAFGGACVAICCWAFGLLLDHLLWPVTQSRTMLGITAGLWLGVYVVVDTAHHRRLAERRQRRKALRAQLLAAQGHMPAPPPHRGELE